MSTIVSVSGSSYSVPAEGDSNWASDVTNLLIKLSTSTAVLQSTSTTFSLAGGDLDFGSSYGVKSLYLKSRGTNPSTTGILRLANTESVSWRNAANGADLALSVNASNILQFNGSSVLMPGLGSIVNADVNASAAIAYSKLNLTGSILNADVNASAAIAYSKLNLAGSVLNADINASAAIAYSKLNLTGAILNADLAGSIANSKLATMANNTVKGNTSGSTATPSDLTLASAATASTVMYRDSNANVSINNFNEGFATTTTAAGTTTLTVASAPLQQFTGTTTQNVVLPAATTLSTGVQYQIFNRSTGSVTVKDGASGTLQVMLGGTQLFLTCAANGTAAGTWDLNYTSSSTLPIALGGTGQTTKAAAFDALHPMTTTGDMIYSSSGVTSARLPIGSSGQVIKSVGGVPTWATFSGGINYLSSNPDAEADTSGWATYNATQTASMTIASPAVVTVTTTNNFYVGMPLTFSTTGALPTGVTAGTTYYVSTVVGATTFQFSATQGGAAVNTSGTQSGVHTFRPGAPMYGVGGSANITWTRSTSSPLRGAASFLYTKDAANRQGEGVAYDFSIDATDKAKVLQISFDYKIASGTYADSDLTCYLFDVSNSTLIQPAGYSIVNASVSMKQVATFQTASNSTSYRIIIASTSTSASTYTVQFDNFSVGPQSVTNGSAVTDWVSFTPTFVGLGTPTNVGVKSRRVGDTLEIWGTFTTGTVTGSTASMTLGYNGVSGNVSIDTTKLASGTVLVGHANIDATSATYFGLDVLAITSTNLIEFGVQSSTASSATAAPGTNIGSTRQVNLYAKIPISGWSSNTQLSTDTDTRVVAATYYNSNGQSLTSTAIISTWTKAFDTHSMFNATTGVGTIPVTGYYRLSWGMQTITATGTPGEIRVRKNSSTNYRTYAHYLNVANQYTWDGSVVIQFNAGDTFDLQIGAGAAGTFYASPNDNWFSVERLTGPSVVASSEVVSAHYTGAPPTGTLNNSFNAITFGTKVKDTHGAYSGSTFTTPVSGTYSIATGYDMAGTFGSNASGIILIYVNGSEKYRSRYVNSSGAAAYPRLTVLSYPLLAGDTVQIYSNTDATSPTYGSSSTGNFFSIVRTGNY